MTVTHKEAGLPIRSGLIARSELLELTAIHPSRLGELLELGWLEPIHVAEGEMLFRHVDVYRIRKLERICTDFELPSLGGTIIVDLLGRIEMLERRLREFERMHRL